MQMIPYAGVDRDAEYLVNMMFAPMYTKICFAAIELDVFSALMQATSAAELAQARGWHAVNTGFFLDALAGMQLLQKDGDRYQNTRPAAQYLVRGKGRYMGDFMTFYSSLNGYEQLNLADLVRLGPQAAAEEHFSDIPFAEQSAAMRNAQQG